MCVCVCVCVCLIVSSKIVFKQVFDCWYASSSLFLVSLDSLESGFIRFKICGKFPFKCHSMPCKTMESLFKCHSMLW